VYSLSGDIENNIRFPGQYYDEETGFHYNYFRYYDPRIGRYLRPDPIYPVGVGGKSRINAVNSILNLQSETNPYFYCSDDPIRGSDRLGLYRMIGGGFAITAAIFSVSISVHTEVCCDERGRKHIRTIQTVCLGIEIGLGLRGSHGACASVSDEQEPKRCPKIVGDSGWYSEDSGVWGALVVGRSYSRSHGTGWKIGLGGGWALYLGCRNEIIRDVISGKCCP